MFDQRTLTSLFILFAFASQALLLFNFAALKWKPEIQHAWGWIVYASGLVALALGFLFLAEAQAWYYWLACFLFAVWTLFGYVVDILRPVNWRNPILWQIFIPYLALYISAQLAFWIPLWSIWPGYWIIYIVLYSVNTVLNISTHPNFGKVISH